MTLLKLILCGAAALAALPALACTCPPFETAAAQAESADFIAVVTVMDSLTLPSPDAEAAEAAEREFEANFTGALITYAKALSRGEDTRSYEAFLSDFYAATPPPPQIPVSGPSTLTQMSVQRVLKGDPAATAFVRASAPGQPTCGISYRKDTELLLLARGTEGLYRTSMCSLPQFPVDDFDLALGGETSESDPTEHD